MGKGYQKKVDALVSQLKPGERVEEVAHFSCAASMCIFFAVAFASLIAGRILIHTTLPVFSVSMLTNLLSMWMMVDAARALYTVQNSCVVVTNRRTFGTAGGKEFDLSHKKLVQAAMSGPVWGRVLFLDGGDAQSSVVLRSLTNKQAIYQAICRHK